jgi:hypothetical protein
MKLRSDFSVQAHMPQACEAKRAGAKKERKAPVAGDKA